MTLGVVSVGCGWSPPSAPPTSTQACGPSDAPGSDTVQQAIADLPQGPQWRDTAKGNTPDCRLHWVVVKAGDASDSPQQVLFFDRNNSARPGHTRAAGVHQRHLDGQQHRRCAVPMASGPGRGVLPTGIGTVRFQIGDDGKIKSLTRSPTRSRRKRYLGSMVPALTASFSLCSSASGMCSGCSISA